MIQRLMRQVAPLELRVQAVRGPELGLKCNGYGHALGRHLGSGRKTRKSGERAGAAGAPVEVDTPGALPLFGGAGLAISSLPRTLSAESPGYGTCGRGKLSFRTAVAGQPGWMGRWAAHHCWHGNTRMTQDVASASSSRGLSDKMEQLTMLIAVSTLHLRPEVCRPSSSGQKPLAAAAPQWSQWPHCPRKRPTELAPRTVRIMQIYWHSYEIMGT
jgi:hypothetical protein